MSEVVELLRGLIRIDTSNPPGEETPAAEYLQQYLEAAGVQAELVAKDPARANLVARLRGGDGPTLALLGHLDVVPAEPKLWDVYPFAGELRDGEVWGRGAVDMKCWVAASCVALARLARDGFKPAGDVLFLGSADEEQGEAGVGMPWLVEQRPDVRADFTVNEGAGERFEVGGRAFYTYATGDKGSTSAKVRVRGQTGDPSARRENGNALVAAAELVQRLATWEPPLEPSEEATRLLETIGAADVDAARALHPLLDHLLPPLVAMTLTPVGVTANRPENMIPDEAELTVACRPLPGATRDDVERRLREALGPGDYEVELGELVGATRSPFETPLRRVLEEFVDAQEPGAQLVPTLSLGYTCSHVMREAFGAVAYGFVPFRHQDPMTNQETKHAPNERVRVADLELQVDAALHLARSLAS